MSTTKEPDMAEQIDDLTQSLNRTSDVLITADRMIDHYRNLNTEQESVIAKLKEDLQRSKDPNKENDFDEFILSGEDDNKTDTLRRRENRTRKSYRESNRKIVEETSSDPYEEEYDLRSSISSRKKSSYSPRVRFKETETRQVSTDYEVELLKSTLSEFQRKQESLEAGLRKNQEKQEEAIIRLDSTIRKQLTYESNDDKSFEINTNLKKLQQQLEKEHEGYSKQKQDVETISKEMKTLKEVIAEATIPKRTETNTSQTSEIDKKLTAYKRKVNKQEDTIKLLKEQLESKRDEASTNETTLFKMQSLEKLKSEQLKLLEQQVSEEKNEKLSMLKEFENIQKKLTESNKERAELLYHLTDVKSDAQDTKLAYEQCSVKIPQMKTLLGEYEKQKDDLIDQVEYLKKELHSNNNVILKLKSQSDEASVSIRTLESENVKLSKQVETSSLKDYDVTLELQRTKQLLSDSKTKCETLEASKKELKEKAVKTLKEYRYKHKRFEDQIQNQLEQLKTKEIELSKAVSNTNEQEIINLKQKKELQQLSDDVITLQQRIVESENKRNQMAFEKCHLEEALTKVNELNQINHELQRDLNELKYQNQDLTSEIRQEKSIRQDAQASLQEHLSQNSSVKESKVEANDDTRSLRKQLEEQSEKLLAANKKHSEELSDMKKEYRSILKEKETKMYELAADIEKIDKALKTSSENYDKLSKSYDDVEKQLKNQENLTGEQMDKVKMSTQKFRKVVDENKKIRKQLQEAREEYDEKLRTAQMQKSNHHSMQREQTVLVQKDNVADNRDSDLQNDAIAKIFTILLQDSENLLGLLSHEEENVPNVKVVPHNVLPEHRRAILEIREKYQTCFSITKTLKGRFQQQKSLIRRAQEKIKAQIEQMRILSENRVDDAFYAEQISTLEALRKKDQEKIESLEKLKEDNEEKVESLEAMSVSRQRIVNRHKECEEKIADFEESRNKDLKLILKKDTELADLKRRISELTRDLEGCTRALHKSIEVDKERKSVLNEIDLLKSEHKERQKIDEDYFRYNEKIVSLTEQLNEAKHSLHEIKQDSVDRTTTTNRLIETFGTVSPSRKRRLFFYDSPLCKSTKNLEDEFILANPTRDTDDHSKTINDSLEDILLQKAGAGLKLS